MESQERWDRRGPYMSPRIAADDELHALVTLGAFSNLDRMLR